MSTHRAHLLRIAFVAGAVTDAQIQEWLHSETVPAFAVLAASDAFTRTEQARDAWLSGGPVVGRWRPRKRL